MAVFYRGDRSKSNLQDNLKPVKSYTSQCDNQRRPPLQCITNGVAVANGNGGVKRNREFNDDHYISNTVVAPVQNKYFEQCLELIEKENCASLCPVKKDEKDQLDVVILQEYGKDIWKYLFNKEDNIFWPKPNYMNKQKQITCSMRSILIDWLVTVAQEFEVQEQTLYLSVNYIDRFLSHMSVVREKFQLLGTAAMMLAMKVEEVVALDAQEWAHLAGQAYNPSQIIRMEQLLLNVLKFDLNPPTVIDFVKLICSTFKLDKRTLHLSMFLLELSLIEESFSLEHLPSIQAVSSIVLARYLLRKRNPYFLHLETSCGYNLQQLKPIMIKQHRTFEDSPTKELQTIQNKYKTDKYCCVANITPSRLDFEDK